MKPYNLIFLKNNKIILTKKSYSDWRIIQDEYENYIASMQFDTLGEVEEFILYEYKMPSNKIKRLIYKLEETNDDSTQIEIEVK